MSVFSPRLRSFLVKYTVVKAQEHMSVVCSAINEISLSHTLPTRFDEHHGQGKSWRSLRKRVKRCPLDMTGQLCSWTQQLWLPAQDLHKTKPIDISAWAERRGSYASASGWRFIDSWWLLEKYSTFYCCDKHNQKQERKGFISSYYLHSIMKGSQGRGSTRNWKRN